MLDVVRQRNKQIAEASRLSATMAANLQNAARTTGGGALPGKSVGKSARGGKSKSSGFIPNFAKKADERAEQIGAIMNGYEAGEIRRTHIKGIGQVVYNSNEKKKDVGLGQDAILPPRDSWAGDRYKQSFEMMHGYDPYKASKGFIPNFTAPKGKQKPVAGSLTLPSASLGGVALITSKDLAMGRLGFTAEALRKGGIKVPKDMESAVGPKKSLVNVTGIRQYIPQALKRGDLSKPSKNSRFDDMIKKPIGGAVRQISQKLLKPSGKEDFPNVSKIMKLVRKDTSGYPQFAGRIFEAAINTAIWSKDMAGSGRWDHSPKQFLGNNADVTNALIGNEGKGGVGVHISRNKYIDSKLSGMGSDATLKSMRGKLTGTAGIRSTIQEKLNLVAGNVNANKGKAFAAPRGNLKAFSSGFVPNFAGALSEAVAREAGSPGVSGSQVRVGFDKRLYASGGIGVYNSTEGNLSKAIDSHMATGKTISDIQKQGKAYAGFIPNFVEDPLHKWMRQNATTRVSSFDPKTFERMNQSFNNLLNSVDKGEKAIDKAYKNFRRFGTTANMSESSVKTFHRELKNTVTQLKEQARVTKENKTAAKATGRALDRLSGAAGGATSTGGGAVTTARATAAAGGSGKAAGWRGGMIRAGAESSGVGMMAAFMLPSMVQGMVGSITGARGGGGGPPSINARRGDEIAGAISSSLQAGIMAHFVGDAIKDQARSAISNALGGKSVEGMSRGAMARQLASAGRGMGYGPVGQRLMGQGGSWAAGATARKTAAGLGGRTAGAIAARGAGGIGARVLTGAAAGGGVLSWATGIGTLLYEVNNVMAGWNDDIQGAQYALQQANSDLQSMSDTFGEFFKASSDISAMMQGFQKPNEDTLRNLEQRQADIIGRMDPATQKDFLNALRGGADTKELEQVAAGAQRVAKSKADVNNLRVIAERVLGSDAISDETYVPTRFLSGGDPENVTDITAEGRTQANLIADTILQSPVRRTHDDQGNEMSRAIWGEMGGLSGQQLIRFEKKLTGIMASMKMISDAGKWDEAGGSEDQSRWANEFYDLIRTLQAGKDGTGTTGVGVTSEHIKEIVANLEKFQTDAGEDGGGSNILYAAMERLKKRLIDSKSEVEDFKEALARWNLRQEQLKANTMNFIDRMYDMQVAMQAFNDQTNQNINGLKQAIKYERERSSMLEGFASKKAGMFGNDLAMTQFDAQIQLRELDRSQQEAALDERIGSATSVSKVMQDFAGTFAKLDGRLGQAGFSREKLTEREKKAYDSLGNMQHITEGFNHSFEVGQGRLNEFISSLESETKHMAKIYSGEEAATGQFADYSKGGQRLQQEIAQRQKTLLQLRSIATNGKANFELNKRSYDLQRQSIGDRMREQMEVQKIQRNINWGGGFEANLLGSSLNNVMNIQDKQNMIQHFGEGSAIGQQMRAETDLAMAKQLKTLGYGESDIPEDMRSRMIEKNAENQMRLMQSLGTSLDPETAYKRAAMQFEATFKEDSPAELVRRYLEGNNSLFENISKMASAALGSGIAVVPGTGARAVPGTEMVGPENMGQAQQQKGGRTSKPTLPPSLSAMGSNLMGATTAAGQSTFKIVRDAVKEIIRQVKTRGAQSVPNQGMAQPGGGMTPSQRKPESARTKPDAPETPPVKGVVPPSEKMGPDGKPLLSTPEPKEVKPEMQMARGKFDIDEVADRILKQFALKGGDLAMNPGIFGNLSQSRRDYQHHTDKEGGATLDDFEAIRSLIESNLRMGYEQGFHPQGMDQFSPELKEWIRKQFDVDKNYEAFDTEQKELKKQEAAEEMARVAKEQQEAMKIDDWTANVLRQEAAALAAERAAQAMKEAAEIHARSKAAHPQGPWAPNLVPPAPYGPMPAPSGGAGGTGGPGGAGLSGSPALGPQSKKPKKPLYSGPNKWEAFNLIREAERTMPYQPDYGSYAGSAIKMKGGKRKHPRYFYAGEALRDGFHEGGPGHAPMSGNPSYNQKRQEHSRVVQRQNKAFLEFLKKLDKWGLPRPQMGSERIEDYQNKLRKAIEKKYGDPKNLPQSNLVAPVQDVEYAIWEAYDMLSSIDGRLHGSPDVGESMDRMVQNQEKQDDDLSKVADNLGVAVDNLNPMIDGVIQRLREMRGVGGGNENFGPLAAEVLPMSAGGMTSKAEEKRKAAVRKAAEEVEKKEAAQAQMRANLTTPANAAEASQNSPVKIIQNLSNQNFRRTAKLQAEAQRLTKAIHTLQLADPKTRVESEHFGDLPRRGNNEAWDKLINENFGDLIDESTWNEKLSPFMKFTKTVEALEAKLAVVRKKISEEQASAASKAPWTFEHSPVFKFIKKLAGAYKGTMSEDAPPGDVLDRNTKEGDKEAAKEFAKRAPVLGATLRRDLTTRGGMLSTMLNTQKSKDRLTTAEGIRAAFASRTMTSPAFRGEGFTAESKLNDMQWQASTAIAESNIAVDEQIRLYKKLAESSEKLNNSKLSEIQKTQAYSHVIATAMREIAEEQYRMGIGTTQDVRNRIAAENQTAIQQGRYGASNAGRTFGSALLYDNRDMTNDLDNMVNALALNLRDGITDALNAAIFGTKKLKDAFRDLFKDLAKDILGGLLKMAMQRLFGAMAGAAMGYGPGFAKGGMVTGGSGYKDDVPARLQAGEFVIRKSMVDAYGPEFFASLNNGRFLKMNTGGLVHMGDDKQGFAARGLLKYKDIEEMSMAEKTGKTVYTESPEGTSMINRYVYNDAKRPTHGNFEVDPRMSAFALTDPDNPQNELKFERYENLVNYIKEKADFEKEKAQALQDFEDQKRRQARGAFIQAGVSLAVMGLANQIQNYQAKRSNTLIEKYNSGAELSPKELKRLNHDINNPRSPLYNAMDPATRASIANDIGSYNKMVGPGGDLGGMPNYSRGLMGGSQIQARHTRGGMWGFSASGATGPMGTVNRGYFGQYMAPKIGKRAKGSPRAGETDDIAALLTDGEFVMQKAAVDKYGLEFFNKLNSGKVWKFAEGGYVGNNSGIRTGEGGPSAGEMTNNISVTINIDEAGNAQTNTEGGNDQEGQGKALADKVQQVVVRTIIEEKRPGGLLY